MGQDPAEGGGTGDQEQHDGCMLGRVVESLKELFQREFPVNHPENQGVGRRNGAGAENGRPLLAPEGGFWTITKDYPKLTGN